MYYQSMNEAGANTKKIESFLTNIDSGVDQALIKSDAPKPAANFVKTTFSMLENAPVNVVASMFTFGREEVIPNMFRSIISKIDKDFKGRLKNFIYYLDRHIGVDEDEHGPAALKMIKVLCGNDEEKWKEAAQAAKMTMNARIVFWNEILDELK
jgi:pyrroloquinoline quinone (PQQ) biosynthesis protein C